MPSQINNPGNVVNVTANYLVTKPSTRFSTRQLAFVEVEVTGCHTDAYLADSVYSRAVRGVQTVAEVYAVGTPVTNKFMVVIAQDTDASTDLNDVDAGANNRAQAFEDAVRASVGSGPATVNALYKHLSGNGFNSGVKTYTDESVTGNNYPD